LFISSFGFDSITREYFESASLYSPCGSITSILALGKSLFAIASNNTETEFDFPLPVEPTIAQCLEISLSKSIFASRLSETLIFPTVIELDSS